MFAQSLAKCIVLAGATLIGIGGIATSAQADSFGIAHVGKWTRSILGGNVTHSVWHIRIGQLSVWPQSVASADPNSLQGQITAIHFQADPVEFAMLDQHEQEAAFTIMVDAGDPSMGIDSIIAPPSHPDFNVIVNMTSTMAEMILTPLNPANFTLTPDTMNLFDFIPPFLFDTVLMQPLTITLEASNGNAVTFQQPVPIPEPSSLSLMILGLLPMLGGIGLRAFRRRVVHLQSRGAIA